MPVVDGPFFGILRSTLMNCLFAALASCAAPKYHSAKVTHAQQATARHEISNTPYSHQTISTENAEAKVARIYNRLLPTALSINNHVGENKPNWRLFFSPAPIVNAHAADDGVITIYKGILEQCNNDDEVAFVIAHEMAHHIANHIKESKQNESLGGFTGTLLMGLLATAAYNDPRTPYYNQSRMNDMMKQGEKAGSAIGRISYSKQQENEADYIGAYIVHGSGYDLRKASSIFARLEQSNRSQHNERFSLNTHPENSVRLAKFHLTTEEIKNGFERLPIRRNGSSAERNSTIAHRSHSPEKTMGSPPIPGSVNSQGSKGFPYNDRSAKSYYKDANGTMYLSN